MNEPKSKRRNVLLFASALALIVALTCISIVRFSDAILLWSAHTDMWFLARIAVRAGADVDAKDHNEATALHWAASKNKPMDSIIRFLIASGGDVDATSTAGTPLYWAVSRGNLDSVRILLASGADPDADHGGRTPLFDAAGAGDERILAELLAAGADINIRDAEGRTAVWEAAWNDHPLVVDALIAIGADLDATDDREQTILHLAALNGRYATVRTLIARGADVGARDPGGATPLHQAAMQAFRNPDSLDADTRRRFQGIAKALIEAGADIDATDDQGETPGAAALDPEMRAFLRRIEASPQ